MQRVIFLPGMGADSRIFKYLDIPDIEPVYVEWQQPEDGESFTDYGLRLVSELNLNKEDVLIGMSMGGIMAQEIAAAISVKKVILVSSLRSGEKFQLPIELAKRMDLPNRFSDEWLKKIVFSGIKMSTPLNPKAGDLLLNMVDQFDGAYFKWAMNQILNWQGVSLDCPVYQVHGSKDLVFPIQNVQDAVIVEGGTHLMVTFKAKKVSQILTDFLFNQP